MKKNVVISKRNLQQNPLFWSKQGNIAVARERANIFLGIGIASPTQLSQAVPFDELGFLLSAEFLRQQIDSAKVFLLIADQHAWLANKMDREKAKVMARVQSETIGKVIKRLSLKNWQVFMASQLFPDALPTSYEKLEEHDVGHFFVKHHAGIKLGWKFSLSGKTHKTDEFHFDTHFKSIKIASIFTKPGFTLDEHKAQESPYICTNPERRILLAKSEKPFKKLDAFGLNIRMAVERQLKRTSLLFGKVVHSFPPNTSLENKLQIIMAEVFG